ncbi:Kelch motif protein [Planctomycetes bacterium Pla86]|uniref:Kelch motif protein n=2 Tax=Engelhardtia mirabilis TaxID=2528011 RepID=A0A518BN56_9BACT|nr:Kelch motif protein [Planctomycetes bacterium Pla133]QDV02737.1 Kelch motif protein [Planctomycetes bacterium Pla86]
MADRIDNYLPINAMITSAAYLLAVLTPLVPDLELTWTDGFLGSSLDYTLEGDPFAPVILLPSLTDGPTPLSLFYAGETRSLDVGLDLVSLASLFVLDGGGQALVAYPLSAAPALAGVQIRAQAVSIDFSFVGSPFDDLSGAVQTTLTFPGQLFPTDNPTIVSRRGHCMARIPDGRVLLIGGEVTDASGNALSTNAWEVYDPQTEAFTAGATTLSTSRSRLQATPLLDGRVLVTGGAQASSGSGAGALALATTELFDPVTMTFSAGPSMAVSRVQHTATRLLDGRVFVVGGRSSDVDLRHSLGGEDFGAALPAGTELFNPVTNTWSAGPMLPGGRYGHSATLLGDGTVLIVGGRVEGTPIFGGPPVATTDEVLSFDPATNSISSGPSLPVARAFHGTVQSGDGGVFLVGGATSLLYLPGLAPGGEDLALVQSTGLTNLSYIPSGPTWGMEGPPFNVTVDPTVECLPKGGGCYEYTVIDCRGDDVVGSDAGVGTKIFTVEKCGANPSLQLSDLETIDDGTGHASEQLEAIHKTLITTSIQGPGGPVGAGRIFANGG